MFESLFDCFCQFDFLEYQKCKISFKKKKNLIFWYCLTKYFNIYTAGLIIGA